MAVRPGPKREVSVRARRMSYGAQEVRNAASEDNCRRAARSVGPARGRGGRDGSWPRVIMPAMRRRIGRIALKGLTGLSLVLCVGTVGLWVRSYITADILKMRHERSLTYISTGRGEVYVQHRNRVPGFATREDAWQWRRRPASTMPPPVEVSWGSPGFAFRVLYGVGEFTGDRLTQVAVPFWAITFTSSLPWVAHFLLRMRGRSGMRSGLCPRCRYDLTGNLSAVCPECGTPVDSRA